MAQPMRPDIPQWTLGDRLRKAREWSDIPNQGQLADRIGVSRRSVTNYESNRSEPNRPVLLSWALATGVSLDWLLTGAEPGGPDDGGISSTRWYETPRIVRPYRFDALAIAA